jgi:hypothetical protein
MIVAWTGHRPELFREPPAARAAVDATARELAGSGVERFLVGGQRGVDTWAALAGIAQGIPLSLLMPYELDVFTRDWSERERHVLALIGDQADEVWIAGSYAERNRLLANGGDVLVAVWTQTRGGGTAETIDLARAAGTTVREIVFEPSPMARSARGRGI